MDNSSLESMLPDYWAGSLSPEQHKMMEEWLAAQSGGVDSDAQLDEIWNRLGDLPEYRPAPHVRHDFYAMLSAHRRIAGKSVPVDRPWWQHLFASQPAWQWTLAIGIFLLGVVLAPWLNPAHQEMREQVKELNQTINSIAMLQQTSAIDRMQAVEMVSQLRQPNDYVLTALLETLNTDPNVNVRLAAIDALATFYSVELVREGMASSLMHQDSPMVKAVMVDLLLEADPTGSSDIFKQLLNSELEQPLRDHIQQRLETIQ